MGRNFQQRVHRYEYEVWVYLFSHGHTWTYMDKYFYSCPVGREEKVCVRLCVSAANPDVKKGLTDYSASPRDLPV